ncbi:MAG: ribonuclease T2 family protein, partial [Gemmataceae bacterium]
MRCLRPAFVALALVFASLQACAQSQQNFDYWLLSLSWSPQYCANREDDQQCQRPYGFVVHGLWPQNRRGYPENCADGGSVDHRLIERMLPLMPSPSLIRHEWNTHGTCSGMDMEDYFLTIERVRRDLNIPSAYTNPSQYLSTTASAIQDAFIQANPGLGAEDMTLSCAGRYLKEVRICYDKNFK